MPIHARLPQIIGQAISRGAPGTKALVNSEKLALNYAWKGFKHKSSIVGGIRTGLLGGGIIGSIIRDSDNPEMDAQIPFNGSQAGSQNKARGRRRGYGRRYPKRGCRPYKHSRRSSTRFRR